MTLSQDAAQWQQAAAPRHTIMRVNNQHTYSHFIPINHCFSLSVEYEIHYVGYLTLYYKIGFVLDNFAQLYANLSSEHI